MHFFNTNHAPNARTYSPERAFFEMTLMRVGALGLFMCTPLPGYAQTISGVIDAIATALAPIVPMLFGIGFLVFIWSVATFVRASGSDTDLTEARKRIMWSVVGLFFIASLWGIVSIVRTMVGVDATSTCASTFIKTDGSTVTVQSCL